MDIGCGIGGNAFQIAKEYGSNVVGVDLSSNMVTVACDRACLRRDTRVRFMIADITKYDFPPNTFEVIYSRDAIIHIPDKKALFTKCYEWLKPGGRMLITDYHVGEGQLTDEFKEYVKNRQYTLLPLKMYKEAAQAAGFEKAEVTDLTQEFKGTILAEMQRANDNKQEFMQMFSAEKFDYLISGWKNKIRYIDSGCHKWGVLKAIKKLQ
uniref:phosphoethanolamine N-methyltransferase n=1 Tax=Romanomermis culicivorax TaxID=13658 RepID=A0A915JBH6_ROMCU